MIIKSIIIMIGEGIISKTEYFLFDNSNNIVYTKQWKIRKKPI